MKKDTIVNTLLVIGNGFDIRCGVPSKFSQYFDAYCKTKLSNLFICFQKGAFEEARELLISSEDYAINFWSVAFYIHYYTHLETYKIERIAETNWFDIEHLIYSLLTKRFDNGSTIDGFVQDASYFVNSGKAKNLRTINDGRINYNPYFFYICLLNEKVINPYDFLLKELNRFESNFKLYLNNNIPNDYNFNCSLLLKTLLQDIGDFVDILNFNYTIVDDKRYVENQTNIHGTLNDEEIIIGIDYDGVGDNQKLNRFTKTYRNMHKIKEPFKLISTIENILFYGHSLSEADFSYFYSLFDMYNLYEGNLKLFFKYSDYGLTNEQNEINHSKYVERVYSLINKYSSKSHHESNLLHRLLLEGRIIIEKI